MTPQCDLGQTLADAADAAAEIMERDRTAPGFAVAVVGLLASILRKRTTVPTVKGPNVDVRALIG